MRTIHCLARFHRYIHNQGPDLYDLRTLEGLIICDITNDTMFGLVLLAC